MALRHIDWLMIAYIVLFSALLSSLTALTCGSTRVTSFIMHYWISTEVVYLQCWRHMKLQLSWRKSCVHHATSCKATYVRCVWVSSYDLPPALLAEWPGPFTCCCGNTWCIIWCYTVVTHAMINVMFLRKNKMHLATCVFTALWSPFFCICAVNASLLICSCMYYVNMLVPKCSHQHL